MISWPVINPSNTENGVNFAGGSCKLFQSSSLFPLSASKDSYLLQFFFFKLIFSPFISLHLAPSLSRVMLLKGFLLFCNEGSWCCQHRLAASPALLFYSGPAQKVWSPRVTRLYPVSHRTFRADQRQLLLKIPSFYFSNHKALTFRSHAPWNHKFSMISFYISSKHSQPTKNPTVFILPMRRPWILFSIIAFLLF